jgi:cell division protein FtsI (penicillin-binding protein 3)
LKQAKAEKPIQEDDADSNQTDVNALFAAVNDLPLDDPLRQPQQQTSVQSVPLAANSQLAPSSTSSSDKSNSDSVPEQQAASNQAVSDASPPPPKPNYVTISDGKKLNVPSLVGLPTRTAIEMAALQGLQLEISGRGTVREQAPAPGTKVPSGTKIVVRCGR